MGKKGKFVRENSSPKHHTAAILIALSVLLIVGLVFVGNVLKSPDTQDDGPLETEHLLLGESDTATQSAPGEPTEDLEMTESVPAETEIQTEPPQTESETAPVEETSAPETETAATEVTEETEESTVPETTEPDAEATETVPPEPTEPATEPPLEILTFTDADMYILLQISMAEVGCEECVECAALVMRTLLNRVESRKFPNSLYGVIYQEDQFTPVWSGSYYSANPNDVCAEALELVRSGWDESQGALYYEACTGSSWHSRNLKLLFQHCNTRFYK